MKHPLAKDRRLRRSYGRAEGRWQAFRCLLRSAARPPLGGLLVRSLGGSTLQGRIRRRCRLSGRGSAVERPLGLSRHSLRAAARDGRLGGVQPSSW